MRSDLATTVQDRLGQTDFRDYVDESLFMEGVDYFRRGKVTCQRVTPQRIDFIVKGSEPYSVSFVLSDRDLLTDCSCPYYADWGFCKHLIAAQLYAKQRDLSRYRVAPTPAFRSAGMPVVQSIAESVGEEERYDYRGGAADEVQQGWLLLFSLQGRRGYGGYHILPYRLDLSALPPALQSNEPDMALIAAHLEQDFDLKKRLVSNPDLVGGNSCRNYEPLQLGRLRSMLRQSLSTALDSLAWYKATLFWGTHLNPFGSILTFFPGKTAFRLDMSDSKKGLVFEPVLHIGEDRIVYSSKGIDQVEKGGRWIVYEQRLMRLPLHLDRRLLARLERLSQSYIRPEEEEDFFDFHFPKLANGVEVGGQNLNQITENDPEPVKQLVLAEREDRLVLYPFFGYGGFSLPWQPTHPAYAWRVRRLPAASDRPGRLTLVKLLRDVVWENGVVKSISNGKYGLKKGGSDPEDSYFVLRSKINPLEFLHSYLPNLVEAGFEIYGEEQLEAIQVNRAEPTFEVELTSGIDWFDLEVVIRFGDAVLDLDQFRDALRSKQPFVTLSDGTIGQIPQGWFEKFGRLINIAAEELGDAHDHRLRYGKGQLPLIEMLLEEADEAWVDQPYESAAARLRNFEQIESKSVSPLFEGSLRSYQQAGFDWLHFLHDFGCNGILADDMGLGKTVQVLAFLQSLRRSGESQGADLIIMPRSLLINWERETEKFTPDLESLIYYGPKRRKFIPYLDRYDLVFTTYGTILKDAEKLEGRRFNYIVLDESQVIKNPSAKVARAVRSLSGSRRLAMSGTPVENTTLELWSQFAFLSPGFLGSLAHFKREFRSPIEKDGDRAVAAQLRRLVYPFILRRTKDQVATELPPRTDQILYIEMEPAQRKAYNLMRDHYRASILGLIEDQGMESAKMHVLEGLLRLRQMCNHPVLAQESYRGESGKLKFLVDTLETLAAGGHKGLLFSQFVGMLSLVSDELDRRGLPYAYLDGQTRHRQAEVDRFQTDPELPFFLISLKAGGVGLNLTAADHVIHIDPWWNPAVEAQATDRAYRIGQERPVFVNKLIAKDSIEEKILALQIQKQALADQIITTEGGFFKQLTAGDIEGLFS